MKAAALIFGLFISLGAGCAWAASDSAPQPKEPPRGAYQPLKQPVGPPAGAFTNDDNEIWKCGQSYCSMPPRGEERFHEGRFRPHMSAQAPFASGPSRSTTNVPPPVTTPMFASGARRHQSRMTAGSREASLRPFGTSDPSGRLSRGLSGKTANPFPAHESALLITGAPPPLR
jgi:hypothetical protein